MTRAEQLLYMIDEGGASKLAAIDRQRATASSARNSVLDDLVKRGKSWAKNRAMTPSQKNQRQARLDNLKELADTGKEWAKKRLAIETNQ
jgi:hypothetical protein